MSHKFPIVPYVVIIPARMGSTRLPGKMLKDLHGKPMIQHVYEQASKSHAKQVVIATDHEKIAHALEASGAKVVMTSTDHVSGTERLAEVVTQLKLAPDTIVVNVQGDLPLIDSRLIDQVASDLALHPDASIATLAEPISHEHIYNKTNHVKVVLDQKGYALYFSRSPIPWQKGLNHPDVPLRFYDDCFYHHIGIYAYHARYVKKYPGMEASPLENVESLEQLRALWHGDRIHVAMACAPSFPGVDTEDDLEHIRQIMSEHKK